MNLETLIVRIAKEQSRPADQELIQVLTEEDMDQLPFELPEFFEWPSGPQSVSRKGRLLMLAGIKYMKERYPQSAPKSWNESSQSKVDQPAIPIKQYQQEKTTADKREAAAHSERQQTSNNAAQHDAGVSNEAAEDQKLTMNSRQANHATYDISLFQ